MTPKPTASSASAKSADVEKWPETPREAFWLLENACAYLRDYYHDEYTRKNDGWKEHEGARQAFAILAHSSAALMVEEGTNLLWKPNLKEKKP